MFSLSFILRRRWLFLSSVVCLLTSARFATAATLYVPGGTATGIADNTTNTNVGIGTATPSQKLDVSGGGIGFSGSGLNASDKKLFSPTDGDLEWLTHNSATGHGFAISHQGARVVYLNSSGSSYLNGGNVGIGTTTPSSKFHVYATTGAYGTAFAKFEDIWSNNGLRLTSNSSGPGPELQSYAVSSGVTLPLLLNSSGGNVGIGTTNPSYKLDVASAVSATPITNGIVRIVSLGSNPATGYGGGLLFAQQDSAGSLSSYGSITGRRVNNAADNKVDLDFNTGSPLDSIPLATRMTITATGNVGIGTTSPGSYKLAVNGTIHAKEVVVDLSGWSDYVFADDYRLAPLSEVEAHIKAEKHLPGIPSAAEVAQGGVSLGDMQAKLLAKVEELTLHQIEQQKILKAQQTEISALRAALARLSTPN